MKFKTPKTYLIGYTSIDTDAIWDYVRDTGQIDFKNSYMAARNDGLSQGEILCSFYAKLCYKSLVLGTNDNISRIRDIKSNIEHTVEVGHGSVFEHFNLNFVTTDCSRVFTHELVRHRVGTAFSQTSGRYVALDSIDLVLDPILEPVKDIVSDVVEYIEKAAKKMRERLDVENQKMTMKKKLTSAIRRIAPNGQTNEIGWSCNIRTVRHLILMRTNRAAEWEIRMVFNQVADIIRSKFPLMLCGLEREEVDGLYEYTGQKL